MGDRGTGGAVAAPETRKPAPKRKRLGRDERRRQLVEATVRLIGESRHPRDHHVPDLGRTRPVGDGRLPALRQQGRAAHGGRLVHPRAHPRVASPPPPTRCIIERLREIGETPLRHALRRHGHVHRPLHAVPHHEPGRRPAARARRREQPPHEGDAIEAIVREGIAQGSIRADVDAFLFTHEFVGWFLAEDIHCLADLRDGTFSRSSHLRCSTDPARHRV